MRDINLFEGIKKAASPKRMPSTFYAGLALLIVCVLAVGGFYGWELYTQKGLDAQISSMNAAISEKSVNTDYTQAEGNKTRLSALLQYNETLVSLKEGIASYPTINLALIDDIAGRMPADVSILSLGYQSGVLTLNCLSDNIESPAVFVSALKSSPYFDFINYKGSSIYNADAAATQTSDTAASSSAPMDETADTASASATASASETDGTEPLQMQFTIDCYLTGGEIE